MYDIEGFQDYLAEEELSENTIEVYVCGVKKYARMFGEITKSNLIAFKKYLIQNFKPQTVNIRITAILTYCKYIGMPMKLKQVKVPKKTHIDNIISMEQFEYLLRCLEKDDNERWYAYILLLGKTGMRISEALRVKKVRHTKRERRYVHKSTCQNDLFSKFIGTRHYAVSKYDKR